MKMDSHRVNSYEILDKIIEYFSPYTREEATGDLIVDTIFFEQEYWDDIEGLNDVVKEVFGDTVSLEYILYWAREFNYVLFYK